MHTLIPIELLPYLQSVAITETKGSLDELATFNYMYSYMCCWSDITGHEQVTSVASDIAWRQPLIDWFAMLGHHEMRKSAICI
jgi:hypothetical protein